MALTLCPTCRLPVHISAQSCHLCSAALASATTARHVPVAAAVAIVATVAVLARRWA